MENRTIVLNKWRTKTDKGELFTIVEILQENAIYKQLRTDKGYYVDRIDSSTFKILQSGEFVKIIENK